MTRLRQLWKVLNPQDTTAIGFPRQRGMELTICCNDHTVHRFRQGKVEGASECVTIMSGKDSRSLCFR